MKFVPSALRQFIPSRPLPIALIGAGGIARDAHLPAYRKANLEVIGVYDLEPDRGKALAAQFGIPRVYASLDEAMQEAPPNCIFDIAVPASALPAIVGALPDHSSALLQKPLGENLDQASEIRDLCSAKQITAAVNFQLRFAPYVLEARSLIAAGAIGEIVDMEVRVTVSTPWHLWPFIQQVPQFEILYHSIHYIDLLRSFLGEPQGVYANSFARSNNNRVGSAIILNYGDRARAVIGTNHSHGFGLRHQESYVKWEGTRGAIKAQMGLLMNYPEGETDCLEYCQVDAGTGKAIEWKSIACDGSWFPDGFIGTMGSLQQYVQGARASLPTSVEDAFRTMSVVEAAIRSHQCGGRPVFEIAGKR
jgi:predicted dehydrogenase